MVPLVRAIHRENRRRSKTNAAAVMPTLAASASAGCWQSPSTPMEDAWEWERCGCVQASPR